MGNSENFLGAMLIVGGIGGYLFWILFNLAISIYKYFKRK